MINMKLDKKEGEKETLLSDNPYPYGLRIGLDSESIKKLGIESLPDVKSILSFKVSAEVISISDDGGYQNIGLQITDMEIVKKEKKKDLGEKLYGVPRDKTKEGKVTHVEGF